jgi:hypothetical protein
MMDPRQPTPEERGFQEGQRYIPPSGLDNGWQRTAASWCPYTFNITFRTAAVGLLAWLVQMFIDPSFPTPIKIVLWAFYYACIAGAIALPLVSLKALNWAGQLLWIFLFFIAVVWNPYQAEGLGWAFLWTVVGSAVSEVVVRFWFLRGSGDNLLTYRVRSIGRILVYVALALVVVFWVGVKGYSKFKSISDRKYDDPNYQPPIQSNPLPSGSKPGVAPVPGQPAPQPLPPPEISKPEEAAPRPVAPLPVPSWEPDTKFSFNGQPSADGPPSLSYLYNDITFESGDEPTPGMRASVLDAVQTGHIREEQRLSNTAENERMWPSNVKLAIAEASRRVQQDAARLAQKGQSVSGMECRVWALDYSLQLRGSVIFIHNARVQVDCRR